MNGRFEGIIQKVNKPKFINKHTVWSISLKENGKWTSVWRKDQSKADALYRLLVKRMKSNGLGIDLKPTTLSQKQLEISQLCFNRLEANEFLKMDDDSDRVTQTGPELSLVWTGLLFAQCPRVSQCWDVGRA